MTRRLKPVLFGRKLLEPDLWKNDVCPFTVDVYNRTSHSLEYAVVDPNICAVLLLDYGLPELGSGGGPRENPHI